MHVDIAQKLQNLEFLPMKDFNVVIHDVDNDSDINDKNMTNTNKTKEEADYVVASTFFLNHLHALERPQQNKMYAGHVTDILPIQFIETNDFFELM